MKFKHFVVTFTGASQQLTADATIDVMDATIQADYNNGSAFFIGGINSVGTKAVSSTDYGIRIPPPTAAGDPAPPYPLAPWNKATAVNLSKIYVFGTLNEKCVVSYWQ